MYSKRSAISDQADDIRVNIQTAFRIFKLNIAEPMRTILVARNPKSLDAALHILSADGYLICDIKQKVHPCKNNHKNPKNNLPLCIFDILDMYQKIIIKYNNKII